MQSAIATAQEISLVERQTNRYWSLEYLRRHSETVWQAVILMWLREDSRLALIMIEDLGLQLPMQLKRSAYLGEQILLKVAYADPRQDVIQFQEMTYSEAQPVG